MMVGNFKHKYVSSLVIDDDENSVTIIDPSLMIEKQTPLVHQQITPIPI